jgi:hypothetical protein
VTVPLEQSGRRLLDADAGKLYFTNPSERKIIELSVDGSQQRDLLSGL